MGKWLPGLFWGALAGGTAGVLLWLIARRSIEQQFVTGAQDLAQQVLGGSSQLQQQLDQGRLQLAAQIRSDVPRQVDTSIRSTLNAYGITPQVGQRAAALVAYAQSHGLL